MEQRARTEQGQRTPSAHNWALRAQNRASGAPKCALVSGRTLNRALDALNRVLSTPNKAMAAPSWALVAQNRAPTALDWDLGAVNGDRTGLRVHLTWIWALWACPSAPRSLGGH